jgi:protein ImuB
MCRRFVSIWFRHLMTDWFSLNQPELRYLPFVLRTSYHGRMIISAANATAESHGVSTGMVLADARAFVEDLHVLDDKPDLPEKLLKKLAAWCIRFTPVVSVDLPDGIMMDVSGCTHLWGGDKPYVDEITRKLNARGYEVRVAIADTPAVAWGVARFGKENLLVPEGKTREALLPLPPQALCLEAETSDRLHKLGLHQIRQFINMPRASLRKRFGQHFLSRLNKALGLEIDVIEPLIPVEMYEERLPSMEPITTATGIEIALTNLMETLCRRLKHDQKGLRSSVFKCFRVDGKIEQVMIGTSRPSNNVQHILKLYSLKLSGIDPGLGIELFILEAPKVEDHVPQQEKLWEGSRGLDDIRIAELIDKLAGKIGDAAIQRYLPAEHYWPERSFRPAVNIQEKAPVNWRTDKIRPFQLLERAEHIEVTAPIPDYPPMLFRHKGVIHKIVKADGPERIEQEWWLQQGQHRDYYRVEDEEGRRYWIFRLGHYHEKTYQWFLHGFFP